MENHIRAASFLANLLDNQFHIFGLRFGLNGLLGLIPGAGDLVVAGLSLYLVWIGLEMRLPGVKIVEMISNIVINFLLGLLPVIGDAADFFTKANLRNLLILKQHAKSNIVEGEILHAAHPVTFR